MTVPTSTESVTSMLGLMYRARLRRREDRKQYSSITCNEYIWDWYRYRGPEMGRYRRLYSVVYKSLDNHCEVLKIRLVTVLKYRLSKKWTLHFYAIHLARSLHNE